MRSFNLEITVHNQNKHLRYIYLTMSYLRKRRPEKNFEYTTDSNSHNNVHSHQVRKGNEKLERNFTNMVSNREDDNYL